MWSPLPRPPLKPPRAPTAAALGQKQEEACPWSRPSSSSVRRSTESTTPPSCTAGAAARPQPNIRHRSRRSHPPCLFFPDAQGRLFGSQSGQFGRRRSHKGGEDRKSKYKLDRLLRSVCYQTRFYSLWVFFTCLTCFNRRLNMSCM